MIISKTSENCTIAAVFNKIDVLVFDRGLLPWCFLPLWKRIFSRNFLSTQIKLYDVLLTVPWKRDKLKRLNRCRKYFKKQRSLYSFTYFTWKRKYLYETEIKTISISGIRETLLSLYRYWRPPTTGMICQRECLGKNPLQENKFKLNIRKIGKWSVYPQQYKLILMLGPI